MENQFELLILLVPEVGVEPTRSRGPRDFESRASTSSATPALEKIYHSSLGIQASLRWFLYTLLPEKLSRK